MSNKILFCSVLFCIHIFCGFSMGRNQYWAGRIYDLCVYYMTGTPKGSTKSGFMEKPGIEPATPGLQGIALIHYTTGQLYTHQIYRNMEQSWSNAPSAFVLASYVNTMVLTTEHH